MEKANIFNIQKFSVHDGPGIRTTIFFKGCPISCSWCHNPESKSFRKELLHNHEKCSSCGRCGEIWEKEFGDETEQAVDKCLNGALDIAGKYYTVSEILKEAQKDMAFYEQSGGGVTLSGGEALCQIEFVRELAARLSGLGISVAIDTCGHVPYENFEKVLEYADLFLYDIKLMDAELHKKYTGASNELIISNLKRLSSDGAKIDLRLPIIEGVNADEGHIAPLLELCREVRPYSVSLLPYHDIAKGKYMQLKQEYPDDMSVPSDEKMLGYKKRFEAVCSNVYYK